MKGFTSSFLILRINEQIWNDEKSKNLVEYAVETSKNKDFTIGFIPPISSLFTFVEEFSNPVLYPGIPLSPDEIKRQGLSGVIIDTAKDNVTLVNLESTIRHARNRQLITIICTGNEAISAAVSKLDPNGIAFTPEELSRMSTTIEKINPEIIDNHIKRVRIENARITPILYAPILNEKELNKVLNLGLKGFLLDLDWIYQYPDNFIDQFVNQIKNFNSTK
ncbi:hypothetical protein [Candidatus Hodarchaeum mangrovi]